VKGIAEGTITWTDDPDFGYLVADAVPDIDDPELLQPRRLYERQGRGDEYAQLVDRLKTERVTRLQEFAELSDEIVKAAG
jgi:phosphoenolpyruvate carboxykinase (ATP)